MSNDNNFGFNNQNGQMNNNMNMMMNMNYLNMQNELLKCVMEGMGEQPTDNMDTNWNFIMNYVPQLNDPNVHYVEGRGPIITLNFSDMTGSNKKTIKIGHDTTLNEAFLEYGKICNISNENLNHCNFLCNGKIFNMNTHGTIRGNDINDNSHILINFNQR